PCSSTPGGQGAAVSAAGSSFAVSQIVDAPEALSGASAFAAGGPRRRRHSHSQAARWLWVILFQVNMSHFLTISDLGRLSRIFSLALLLLVVAEQLLQLPPQPAVKLLFPQRQHRERAPLEIAGDVRFHLDEGVLHKTSLQWS